MHKKVFPENCDSTAWPISEKKVNEQDDLRIFDDKRLKYVGFKQKQSILQGKKP